eukprot:6136869-Pyramimonas_sp.AAC.1
MPKCVASHARFALEANIPLTLRQTRAPSARAAGKRHELRAPKAMIFCKLGTSALPRTRSP